MNCEPLYYVTCSKCSHTKLVLKSTLRQIASGLKAWRNPDSPIPFICEACKVIFLFDDVQSGAAGVVEPPLRIPRYEHLTLWSTIVGCSDDQCNATLELFAIRFGRPSEELFRAEVADWDIQGICCEKDHPIIAPRVLRIDPLIATDEPTHQAL